MSKKQWKTLDMEIGIEGDNELTVNKPTFYNREGRGHRDWGGGNDTYRKQQRNTNNRDGQYGGGGGRYGNKSTSDDKDWNWRGAPRREPKPRDSSDSSTNQWRDNKWGQRDRDRDRDRDAGNSDTQTDKWGKWRDNNTTNTTDTNSKFASANHSKFLGQPTRGLAALVSKQQPRIGSERFARPPEAQPVREKEKDKEKEKPVTATKQREQQVDDEKSKPTVTKTQPGPGEKKEKGKNKKNAPENETTKENDNETIKEKDMNEKKKEKEKEKEKSKPKEKENKEKVRKTKQKRFMKNVREKKAISDYETVRFGLQQKELMSELSAESIGVSLAQTIASFEHITLIQILSSVLEAQPDAFVEIALEICSSLENLKSPLYVIQLAEKQGVLKLMRSSGTWSSSGAGAGGNKKKVVREFVEYGLQYIYPVETNVVEDISSQRSVGDLVQCLKKLKQQKQYFCNMETLRSIVNTCSGEYFEAKMDNDSLPQVVECMKLIYENGRQGVKGELEGCLGHCVYLIHLWVEKSYINDRVHQKLLSLLKELALAKVISFDDIDSWRNDENQSDAKKEALVLLSDWLLELETQEGSEEGSEEASQDEEEQNRKSRSKKNNENGSDNEDQEEADTGGYDQLDLLQENPNIKTK